jgi:hypothetical protein
LILSEGGKLYGRTEKTAEAVGFYDNMRKLIPAVRAAYIQVIMVPTDHQNLFSRTVQHRSGEAGQPTISSMLF